MCKILVRSIFFPLAQSGSYNTYRMPLVNGCAVTYTLSKVPRSSVKAISDFVIKSSLDHIFSTLSPIWLIFQIKSDYGLKVSSDLGSRF